MTPAPDELRVVKMIIAQANERSADPVKYFRALIAAVCKGLKKYPDDERKAYRHAAMVLDKKYPAREGDTV